MIATTAFPGRSGLWILLLGMALAGALGQAPSVSAQEGRRITADQVTVSEVGDSVTVLVSVLDSSGAPVAGLTQFEAAVDGNSVAVEEVQPIANGQAGVAVLLLLDVSGSMAGEPIGQAKAAAETLIGRLNSLDAAAVLTFAGSAPSAAEFTSSAEQLSKAIGSVRAEGETGTALYDAVVNGLQVVGGATIPRRAVVLLTDGRDAGELSGHSREDAIESSAAAGVPVFAVGLGQDADDEFLQRLAETSGGAWYHAPGSDDVLAIFDAIGVKLRSQYAVTAALPPSEDTDREILVSVRMQDEDISAEAGFRAPATVHSAGGGDGLFRWPWLTAVGGAFLLSGVAAVLIRRRARPVEPVIAGGPGESIAIPVQAATRPACGQRPLGTLKVVAGPSSGITAPVGVGPVDIGSDAACEVRLERGNGAVAGRHARVWVQSNSFILHHLARGRETVVGEAPVEWARLEDGDIVRIGPHSIAFTLGN